jgi:hypothetical protein
LPFGLLSQGCHSSCAQSSSSRQLLCLFSHFVRSSLQSLKIHPLPMLGSPAGRCGLRFCYPFCRKSKKATKTLLQAVAARGCSLTHILSPVTNLAPLAGGSRCLAVQTATRYRSLRLPSSLWLRAVFPSPVSGAAVKKHLQKRSESFRPQSATTPLIKGRSSVGCSFFTDQSP